MESAINNRPLTYVEDDEQLPVLTPNVMLFGVPNIIPETDRDEEPIDLRKRAKHLAKCKEKLWMRWSSEYIKSLRERHNMKSDASDMSATPGDLVMIRGDVPNRGTWRVGVVDSLIVGKDGVTRGANVRTGKSSTLQRAVQQLYPLELSCDALLCWARPP